MSDPRDPRFPMIQRRLKALGLYAPEIDDEFGPGMASGIDTLLARAEKEAGIVAPPAPAADPAVLRGSFLKLPVSYQWLSAEPYLPKHLKAAIALYGTVETPGSASSTVIMGWRDELKAAGFPIAGYSADSVPWCGLFIRYVMYLAARDDECPDGPLWALNWGKFGVDGGQPELGDILTFKRTGGGHVAIYIAEDKAGYYHVLGGNQSDKVSIMRIEKKRMHSCRQPNYVNKAANIRPVIVSAGGSPVSTNER